MAVRHPLGFLAGVEGVALLRAFAGEFDGAFTADRIGELRRMVAAWDAGELGQPGEVGEIGTVAGYRGWAATYDEPGNPLIEVEEPIFREFLAGIEPGAAVDACCGTGRIAGLLAGAGHEVIGVDSSPEMLAVAKGKMPGVVWVEGDVLALPVADLCADLVTCALALTHQPALGPVFAEFARVLRTGGDLVTSDIHRQSLYLGGIASAADEDGAEGRMPASRFLPSDYLTAALAAGFEVRACREPMWPPSEQAGGPLLREWAGPAADAAYENTPAAIVWWFRKV